MIFELKTLFEYASKKGIADNKLASLLGVHYNTIYYWRHEIAKPSALARVRIKEFLIKSL